MSRSMRRRWYGCMELLELKRYWEDMYACIKIEARTAMRRIQRMWAILNEDLFILRLVRGFIAS